jgi:very-short-patch-repair endonuclease
MTRKCRLASCGREFEAKYLDYKANDGRHVQGHSVHCCARCAVKAKIARGIEPQPETKIEKMLGQCLEELKLTHEPQKQIGALVVDEFLPEYGIVIEAQGDYWHTLPRVVKHDAKRRSVLHRLGYHILEIWEKDFRDPDVIKARILMFAAKVVASRMTETAAA